MKTEIKQMGHKENMHTKKKAIYIFLFPAPFPLLAQGVCPNSGQHGILC